MMKQAALMLLTLGLAVPATVHGNDVLANFDGGVGVIPAQNGAGAANPDGTLPNVKLNVVRGVAPGAGPWRIGDLKARIDVDGNIRIKGRGLLLASGNSLGTTANQVAFATLICEAVAPFVERSTAVAVPLEPNGDFRINSTLSPVPTDCASPVLLIRIAGGINPWIAAGIPQRGDEN